MDKQCNQEQVTNITSYLLMIIYESQTTYKAVGETDSFRIDEPDLVAQYMEGAFDDRPMQEQFFVILLNRKNQPMYMAGKTLGIKVHDHLVMGSPDKFYSFQERGLMDTYA